MIIISLPFFVTLMINVSAFVLIMWYTHKGKKIKKIRKQLEVDRIKMRI